MQFKKSLSFFLHICFLPAVLYPLSHADATINWTKTILMWFDLKTESRKETQNLDLVSSTTLQLIIWHNMEVGEKQCRNGDLLNWLCWLWKCLCNHTWLYKMDSSAASDVAFCPSSFAHFCLARVKIFCCFSWTTNPWYLFVIPCCFSIMLSQFQEGMCLGSWISQQYVQCNCLCTSKTREGVISCYCCLHQSSSCSFGS